MNFRINVSLNGHHFFATGDHSCQDRKSAQAVYNAISNKFPASEGYEVSVSYWEMRGQNMTDDFFKAYARAK